MLEHRWSRARTRAASPLLALCLAVALLAAGCVLEGEWATTTPAAVSGAPPAADLSFVDVSCPTADFCMGIGNTEPGPTAYPAAFLQTWDGEAWTELPFAFDDPSHPFHRYNLATGVSCGTPTACVVTWYWEVDDETVARAAVWDGSTFTKLPLAEPRIESFSGSCGPDGSCVVTYGNYTTATWDGASVVVYDTDFAAARIAISCVAIDACIGVDEHNATVRWDGTGWNSNGSIPIDPDRLTRVADISCARIDRCLAVGHLVPVLAAHHEPVAFRWDGTLWTTTPLPVTGTGALRDVSCSSSAECVAVGSATVASPSSTAEAALAWNGRDWYVVDGPPAPSGARYEAIGCSPANTCIAAGGAGQQLLASTYTWSG
jgi:hypothetical protein